MCMFGSLTCPVVPGLLPTFESTSFVVTYKNSTISSKSTVKIKLKMSFKFQTIDDVHHIYFIKTSFRGKFIACVFAKEILLYIIS